jgi:hypothetical protein
MRTITLKLTVPTFPKTQAAVAKAASKTRAATKLASIAARDKLQTAGLIASVKLEETRLKGRPLQAEAEAAAVRMLLKSVDRATIERVMREGLRPL